MADGIPSLLLEKHSKSKVQNSKFKSKALPGTKPLKENGL
jgi:hypothetical protein